MERPARSFGWIAAIAATVALGGIVIATWPRALVLWYDLRLRVAAPPARGEILEAIGTRGGWRAKVRDALFAVEAGEIEASASAAWRGKRIAVEVTLKNASRRAVWLLDPRLMTFGN